MHGACINTQQSTGDADVESLQMSDYGVNTALTISTLDRNLFDACDLQNVENIGNLLKRRSNEADCESHTKFRKDYYKVLDFLLENLEEKYHNSLFDIIKESLGNEIYDEAFGSLLIIAARRNCSIILGLILNKMNEMWDNKSLLKYWLNNRDKYGRAVLTHVILRQDKESSGVDCMEVLMSFKQYLDIDAKDCNGYTALHYAVLGEETLDRTLAALLIRNGACINIKNKEGICVIKSIPAIVLEDILNSCIEEPNGFTNDRKKENYALKMDFSIFSHKENNDERNESELIKAVQNSQSHYHLLYHPLVTTFLHMKWQKVKYIWYLNLLFNVTFYTLILLYMYLYREYCILNETIGKKMNLLFLKIVLTIIGSFLMTREVIQFYLFKNKYIQSFENYLEVTILVLTFIMLYIENLETMQIMKIMAWLVVFISAEFLLLLEKLHLL
ncbi:unnamed protein product, partial [Meganyctiphanes norvegica]